MTTVATTSEVALGTEPDGRRARRDRNRTAVVDAVLGLYREGHLTPSVTEIAERAGLSPRSLFRYFDDVEDLTRAAIARQNEQVWPLAALDVSPDEPLDVRLDAFIDRRVELFEAIGSVGRVARLREPFHEVVARQLADGRALLRDQIARLFAAELEAIGAARSETLAALDVLASYESYRLLRDDQRLSQRRAAAVVRSAMAALLAPAGTDVIPAASTSGAAT